MSRAFSLAGFEVTLIGRFWVTTEAPEQTIHFDSVIVSSTGDVCYFAKTTDARQTSELVFAFFAHDATGVQFGLEFADVNGQCDGLGSRDLTAFAEGVNK